MQSARKHNLHSFFIACLVSCALLLSACHQASPPESEATLVSVLSLKQETAQISTDLPGRVSAIKDAQIRARVTGIIQKIVFKQGANVSAGEVLFQIDPALYQAAYDQASANLKKAQADAFALNALAKRYKPLVEANAVSKQEYDNAVANDKQSQATVAAAKAALATASINLAFTRVISPITGRIGKALVTEGALVDAVSATQMAVVQQINPVYVDLNQSLTELSKLRKMFNDGTLEKVSETAARVEILMEDGSVYPQSGRLLFTGITVNEGTGQVVLRAEIDNPDEILLPGMFVRVRVAQGINKQAILIPPQALQRGTDGKSYVLTVVDGKVVKNDVEIGLSFQGRTIVTKGLTSGSQLIVEGFQKIRQGSPVKTTEWNNKTKTMTPSSNSN
jgi:membrane fusion protein (multidrug efflux system)